MEIVEKNACYGCGNCENICPKKAVSMDWDEEGFLYPVIDEKRCVDCGLCRKVCPAVEPMVSRPTHDIACYGGRYEDAEKVKQSSSGGAASALSELIIAEGGSVYGSRYGNGFQEVVTSRAVTKQELEAFKGSKYVQSQKKDIFVDIEQELDKGIKVLYVGCPCEIAALKKWIKTERENLYTAELICAGVTSPLYLRDYIAGKAKKNGGKRIIGFTMRDPSLGWSSNYTLNVEFSDHEEKEQFSGSVLGDAWGLVKRPSCYRCKYKGNNRVADITLGDLWGINRSHPHYSEWGNSLLLVHTQKGEKLVEKLEGFRIYGVDMQSAYQSNKMMTECCIRDALRNKFIKEYRRKGLSAAAYAVQPIRIRIKMKIKKKLPDSVLPFVLRIWHKIIDR